MKNGKLKGLICSMGKNQRSVSVAAKIPESRLSHFINGRLELTPKERKSLAKVLKINEAELDEQTALAAAK
jgi:plasmid maintenance system antidote protein VapI